MMAPATPPVRLSAAEIEAAALRALWALEVLADDAARQGRAFAYCATIERLRLALGQVAL